MKFFVPSSNFLLYNRLLYRGLILMKKTALVISLVLLLLVSCATKKPVETEVEPEVVQAVVVEDLNPENVPTPAEPETIIYEEEKVEEPQLIPEEEVTEVVEPEETVFEVPSEETSVDEQTIAESDWSKPISSSEQTVVEQPKAEPTTQVSAPEAESEQPKPSFSRPSAPEPLQTEQEASVPDKVIQFISHEILFSVGLLVCAVGLVYFIIALVRSSSSHSRRKAARRSQAANEPEKQETQDSDSDLSDEDDEFLKALLRDERK
ncbi:MAG: hypothetical protein J5800_06220 [Spirochaetales bacterium]|nr:hypothetical protein [Spirochaetales bacterium]